MSGSTPTALPAEYPFPTVLDPVSVPPDCFPIEVVQFWRGEHAPGRPLPLHWAIVVRTSARRGNCHEIVGDMDTYATQDRFDVPLHHWGGVGNGGGADDWRGSHVVGYVSPARLDDLLNHIALVPVVRHRLGWNCQNWVYEALKGLSESGALYTDGQVTLARLQMQMGYLLDAWEVGDI